MEQSIALLQVIFLLTLSNLILCSNGQANKEHITQANGQLNNNDSIVVTNIHNIFSTNFGPGLYLFNNTAPYPDQMIEDQPDPYSSPPTSAKELFKVQSSPNGKLKVQTALQGSDNGHSKKDEFSTHFSGGLPLTTHKVETTSNDNKRGRDDVAPLTVDAKDCLESDAQAGKPFCTRLRNYPEQEHLEEIIKTKFANLESFFGEDLPQNQNISQRFNNEPLEMFLCKSRTRVIYPEAGLSKDYDWLFIINTKKYKQGIHIEECVNEGSVCGKDIGLTLHNRYTATCKQSYIYRSLVAYANETIIKDQFKMPSTCKCVLTVS